MANSKNIEVYVVRQGDHLQRLASERGFDAETVWNDPKNGSLRKQGRQPHLLAPGDVLYIPETHRKWLPIQLGQLNAFTVPVSHVTISATLAFDGKVLADEACLLHTQPPRAARTDAQGLLSIQVSCQTSEVVVEVPRIALKLLLQVGHLDPVTTESGVVQRLDNLGYLRSGATLGFTSDFAPCDDQGGSFPVIQLEPGELEGPLLRHALAAFQRDAGLTPTGEINVDTEAALVDRYGV